MMITQKISMVRKEADKNILRFRARFDRVEDSAETMIQVADLAVVSGLHDSRQRRVDCFRPNGIRSEEHTSELQSQSNLVCRLLLETNTTDTARPGGRHDRERAPRERVHRPARREPLHDLPETLWNGAQRSRPGPPALQRALHAGDD